jgi:cell division protein FtsB
MKLFGIAALLLLLVLLGGQMYTSSREQALLQEQVRALQERVEKARGEQEKLQRELEYFSQPDNIEKELRARFNYNRQGEKVIIIVPPSQSSTER